MARIRLVLIAVLLVTAGEVTAYGLGYRDTGWISWAGWAWSGWTALTGIATFLAVAAALALGVWGDELRRLGRQPRLSLTLVPIPDHFQKFLTGAGPVYTVRISVTNEGDRPARNVEVWAQELKVELQPGVFVRDPVFMAMNLIRTHVGGTVTPVVHPGIPKPYDVGKVVNEDLSRQAGRKRLLFELSTEVGPELVQPAGLKGGLYPSWKPPGTYRLTLAIAADGIDVVQRVVEIRWTGQWDDDPDVFFRDELHIRIL
jgi:hypothetical protein